MTTENKNTKDGLESVEGALTKTEHFIEKNQKGLMIAVLAIVIIVGGYWAFMKFVKEPKEEQAKSQMFFAENYFEVDSFALALNGDGNYSGFLKIATDFSSTKAGNLANYYSGICYLHLGDYDNAIKYLEEFETSEMLLSSISKGAIGDAYIEKGEIDKGIEYYKKAVIANPNEFTTPIYLKKLGLTYEKQGKYQEALTSYNEIFTEYSTSTEARTIEKYIARVKIQLKEI